MESNNYEWFIADTVEKMLPRFSDPKLVLTMCVTLEWHDFGYDEDGNTQVREPTKFSRNVWLVFQRPNNYTKVLVTDQELSHITLDQEPIRFKQYSDHDTCWRSDGFRWMFETFIGAWDYFEKKGIEGRNIDPHVHWNIFGGKPTYWLLESLERVEQERDKRWSTDYMVKFDKKISLQEAAYKYMPDEKSS